MKWNHKIPAGSLQFVLFIGVVIALLLLTFVTLAHTNSLFHKKTTRFVDTIKAADLALSTSFKTPMPINDSTAIVLPSENLIQAKVIRNYWGVLEKYTVVSSFKKNRFTKSVLVGSKSKELLPALYLQDRQRPMIIVGKAKITGEAFLPKQGIRPGNISGNSFYGTSLVSGRQRESAAQLPKLDAEFRQMIQLFTSNQLPNTNLESLRLSRNMLLKNSFQQPAKLIQGDVLELSGVSLSGHIIIKASRRIIVEASSSLKDIVLIAPEIILKNGITGNFQALASKRIEVGKNCNLSYPSALVVNNKTFIESKNNRPKPNIAVGSNSLIKGFLVYLESQENKQTFAPQIKIASGANIWGEIYCEQNLELKGDVFGSVYTAGFMALESGSIYQNHLFNGTINSSKLPQEYAGLPLQKNNTFKALTKWLY